MIVHLKNLYYRITYHHFGWHRDKIILSRELVTVFDIKAYYGNIEVEKINIEINELETTISKLKQAEELLVEEVNTFQRISDIRTSKLMTELIELKKQLAPDNPDLDKIHEYFEGIKDGFKKTNPLPKVDRANEDKKLKKLYMQLAKIYHPDKAPKGREDEYTEIFKTLTAYRNNKDLTGLKAFAKTLKKNVKRKKKLSINYLRNLRNKLKSDILQIQEHKREFQNTTVYQDLLLYRKDPEGFIRILTDRIQLSIHNLKRELQLRDINTYRREL